jgi:two-component system sensor histidine kinase KdpD
MEEQSIAAFARRLGLGALATGLLTLICYHARIDFASSIPFFLLVIVGISLTGDFKAAITVSVFAAGCLDFFFTEPLFSLYMRNPLEVFALISFAVTALVITRLVSRVRAEELVSRAQREQMERLYLLSQQLVALPPDKVMTEPFLEPFRRLFGVTAICVYERDSAEARTVGQPVERLQTRTREAFIGDCDVTDLRRRIAVRRLRTGAGPVAGAIGFEGVRAPAETIGSLAGIAAALIERAKAFQHASAAAIATQAEVYRSAMLDALAHEFQTPLAVILAAAGGLREAGPLLPGQRELAETVENESARLGSLTSRLLRTARLDREELNPRMEWTDLGSLASQVVAQYGGRSPDRTIDLRCDPEEIEARVDPEMLRIGLSQLVENACKYSIAGSTVSVVLAQESDGITLRVSNDGSSISTGERYKIFDRFYRGSDVKRATPGSGLGLYVARKIASAHGGSLELEPAERAAGRVTFCLTLPTTKEAFQHVLATE